MSQSQQPLSIKNLTEQRVMATLQKAVKKGWPPDCRCPACLAQIAAGAINMLPPKYCREHSFGLVAVGDISQDKIGAVLRQTGPKVNPVYCTGKVPEGTISIAPLVNLVREQVSLLLSNFNNKGVISCPCPSCLSDILIITLNSLPQGYLPDFIAEDARHRESVLVQETNLLNALRKGIKLVGQRPHHDLV